MRGLMTRISCNLVPQVITHPAASEAVLTILEACKNDENETILYGILPDLKNESITLVPIQDYIPGLTMPDSYPTVKTDSVCKYEFIFIGSNGNFYQIVHNNYHQLKADIYLEAGDSIFIN